MDAQVALVNGAARSSAQNSAAHFISLGRAGALRRPPMLRRHLHAEVPV